MKVILWEEHLKTIHNKEFEPEVICEIEPITKFPRGLISVNGNLVRCCSFDISKDILAIEFVDNPIDEDEIFQNEEIKCPYCGNAQSDSWEYDDSGNEICDSCGSEYMYERIVEVSYTTVIKNKNINTTILKLKDL